eukprot:12359_1
MFVDNDKWYIASNISENLAASSIISLNGNEIICASHNESSIYKLNIDNHQYKWEKLTTRPKTNGFAPGRHLKAVFHKTQNKMYLYGGTEDMYIFDLQSKQWKQISSVRINGEILIEHCIFYANNSIHLIGGDTSASHQIWDTNQERFREVFDFSAHYKHIRYGCCVYAPNKQAVFLIGGMISDNPTYKAINCIWQYSLKSGTWKEMINIPFDYCNVSAVLTDDERYVIIAGGWKLGPEDANQKGDDAIFALDTNTLELKQSTIKCPKPGSNHLVKTGVFKAEWIVHGYVKRLFRTNVFQHMEMPPLCIVKKIEAFFSKEMLHWIDYEARYGRFPDSNQKDKYKHYVISLAQIITNLN